MSQDRKFVTMSVKDFINSTKPPKAQVVGGALVVNESKVKELARVEDFMSVLNAIHNPIVLAKDGQRLQGNHRYSAAKLLFSKSKLDPNGKIVVHQFTKDLTDEEAAQVVFRGNNGTSKQNNGVLAVKGAFKLSRRVIYPIFQVFESLKIDKKIFTKDRIMRLSRLFAGYLNENPSEVECIRSGKYLMNISGADIYQARSTNAGNDKFVLATPNVNLTDKLFRDFFGLMLEPAIKIITEMKFSGDWKRAVGNNTNLEYIILAAALRGELSSKERHEVRISMRKFTSSLKDANKVKNLNSALEGFLDNPLLQENRILDIIKK